MRALRLPVDNPRKYLHLPTGTLPLHRVRPIIADFVKNFIAAEVVAYADFAATSPTAKGFADVKAAGKYRTEGRQYVVADGDIILFKIGQSKK